MSSTSERGPNDQTRTYRRGDSIVFLRTKEPFGGLSNMAGGFPLCVNGLHIRTSEALYQACRFPHMPDVQKLIIEQRSPMTAKMKSKPHRSDSRADWDRVRVKIMRWCLRVKLAQNWASFSRLLQETGDRPIVEESWKDTFWGAKPVGEDTLVGMNVLGRLLMELREAVKQERHPLRSVEPLGIPEFLLFGRPIELVCMPRSAKQGGEIAIAESAGDDEPTRQPAKQTSLFDVPAAREAPTRAYIGVSTSKGTPSGDLKPYPVVKDSGVPWLGDVPAHWDVHRLRNAAEMRVSNVDKHTKDEEQPVRLCNYVDVYKNDRIRSGMSFMRATATVDEIERFRLRTGDVLITKDSEAWNDIGVPALVEETADDLISGYHLALLRPFEERVDGGYLFRALQSTGVAYQFHVEANGVTRYGLSHSAIKSAWLPLPPLPEQAAIVRFLDHADRRIRRYIRAKQKLIKLLEEHKQAAIHHAVTRGLDPKVRLKPSGVEWLGDVPEHWDVRRNGRLFAQRSETGFPELPILEVSLRTGVRIRDFNNSDRKQMLAERDKYKRARAGDIAYNMMRMWQGAAGVAPTDGLVSPAYVVAKPLHGTDPRYYERLFRTAVYMAEADKYSRGIVKDRNRLYWEDFKRMPSCYPPPQEQIAIADTIDDLSRETEIIAERLRSEIELLREYRTRLIADVVTGKLDVRGAAARLPDEADRLDSLDEADVDADDDTAEDTGENAELGEVEV